MIWSAQYEYLRRAAARVKVMLTIIFLLLNLISGPGPVSRSLFGTRFWI